MNEKRFYFFTMLALVLVLGYLSYLILRPFLTSLGWAIVFSIVFFPIYKFILRFVKWTSLGAAITVVFVCILILGPFSYCAYLLTSELSNVSIMPINLKGVGHILNNPAIQPLLRKVLPFLDISQTQLQASIVKSLTGMGARLLQYLPDRLSDVAEADSSFCPHGFRPLFSSSGTDRDSS